MLPKWFNKWNRDNPTNVERPAIIIGAVGVAVFAVIVLVVLGQPFRTQSLQTGPRGTGMMVTKFVSDARTPDPTIAGLSETEAATDPVLAEEADVETGGGIVDDTAVDTEAEIDAAEVDDPGAAQVDTVAEAQGEAPEADASDIDTQATEEVVPDTAAERAAAAATETADAPAADAETATAETAREPTAPPAEGAATAEDDTAADPATAATDTDAAPAETATPAPAVETAGDARENVPPGLEGLSVENYDRLLTAMRKWTGIPNLFDDPESYQTTVGHIMVGMTRDLNENWDGHVNANGQAGVTCYTCHRGQPVPSGVWFNPVPVTKATEGWAAVQNRVTPLSTYTSLPSDALQVYLVDRGVITIHDLESRVAGVPGIDDYPGTQHAERTFALMNHFSQSLGVNCTFCHNTRAFYDTSQVTPQWATGTLGIGMVQELNNDYLPVLGGILPPERLNREGDYPKVGCSTCHKGYQRPLQGTNVIGNWPELAGTEPAASN